MEQNDQSGNQSGLSQILDFLQEIGIAVHDRELDQATFLPGLELGPSCIYVDYSKLKYPGDLLHEAGHLAVTPLATRQMVGTGQMAEPWPTEGEEIGAVLWSYAAARHINLPLSVVFHPHGYKDDSAWLIEMFESGQYIGLPFLEWAGLSLGPQRAQPQGVPPFPHMLKWLRD
jgi:hypothetical protein